MPIHVLSRDKSLPTIGLGAGVGSDLVVCLLDMPCKVGLAEEGTPAARTWECPGFCV